MKFLLKSVVALLIFVSRVEGQICPCLYNVQNEPTCEVYSKTSGGQFQNWTKAPDLCLSALNISDRILNSSSFWLICPNPNSTNVSYAELISILQSNPKGSIAQQLMANYSDTGIFNKSSDGTYVLAPSFVAADGTGVNCSATTTTIGLCWNAVTIELRSRQGKITTFCKDIYQRQTLAYKIEQAKARVSLCTTPNTICEPLSSEVGRRKTSNCGDLLTYIANNSELPNCTKAGTNSTDSGKKSAASMNSVVGAISLSFLSFFM